MAGSVRGGGQRMIKNVSGGGWEMAGGARGER